MSRSVRKNVTTSLFQLNFLYKVSTEKKLKSVLLGAGFLPPEGLFQTLHLPVGWKHLTLRP